jgi:hypothetical protein
MLRDDTRGRRPVAGTCAATRLAMSTPQTNPESGKIGYAVAWLLGVPLPILLIVYLISRC